MPKEGFTLKKNKSQEKPDPSSRGNYDDAVANFTFPKRENPVLWKEKSASLPNYKRRDDISSSSNDKSERSLSEKKSTSSIPGYHNTPNYPLEIDPKPVQANSSPMLVSTKVIIRPRTLKNKTKNEGFNRYFRKKGTPEPEKLDNKSKSDFDYGIDDLLVGLF